MSFHVGWPQAIALAWMALATVTQIAHGYSSGKTHPGAFAALVLLFELLTILVLSWGGFFRA